MSDVGSEVEGDSSWQQHVCLSLAIEFALMNFLFVRSTCHLIDTLNLIFYQRAFSFVGKSGKIITSASFQRKRLFGFSNTALSAQEIKGRDILVLYGMGIWDSGFYQPILYTYLRNNNSLQTWGLFKTTTMDQITRDNMDISQQTNEIIFNFTTDIHLRRSVSLSLSSSIQASISRIMISCQKVIRLLIVVST